ncbi:MULTISPECIES: DedA family protein [Aequorivita]|uniref:DedA family protein n=1 Tax=Aequorivita iocasae TaxID=2803865 RepID=A0ABX7DSM2_9FLAO|nr:MULTISPECIES: DedA family protein [Aequorivita]QQX76149.1 DedA family protein [Aequorivita iocasae]UCA55608.1 DedA family protein [Aequorivita sp. F7]
MEVLNNLIDFALNIDQQVFQLVFEYGIWIYVVLFLIVFMETGLVFMAFLPGDVLLFTAGAFCAGVQNDMGQTAELNLGIILLLLIMAAILGDGLNYYIGKNIGLKVLQWKIRNKPLVHPKYILKTNEFYEHHGAKTIIIARFLPIVRTFAPFVAGIGAMAYSKFLRYNVIGALIWVLSLVLLGYFFGNLPFVKNNFEAVVAGIIILSLSPLLMEIVRTKIKKVTANKSKQLTTNKF